MITFEVYRLNRIDMKCHIWYTNIQAAHTDPYCALAARKSRSLNCRMSNLIVYSCTSFSDK